MKNRTSAYSTVPITSFVLYYNLYTTEISVTYSVLYGKHNYFLSISKQKHPTNLPLFPTGRAYKNPLCRIYAIRKGDHVLKNNIALLSLIQFDDRLKKLHHTVDVEASLEADFGKVHIQSVVGIEFRVVHLQVVV